MTLARPPLRFYSPPVRTLALVLPLLLAVPAGASSVHVEVTGMDCEGCNKGLSAALNGLDFLEGVNASFVAQGACGELVGDLDSEQVAAAVAGTGKAFVSATVVEQCPEGLRGALPDPWAGRGEGLDVVTISHGEQVDVAGALVAGKYTVVDYGAPWCGPCHEAAELLATYLRAHPDVAVRAVDLGGQTPDESYNAPVVAQHLEYVDGIPWIVVHDPTGKVVHKSNSATRAIEAIEKHRERKARRKGGK